MPVTSPLSSGACPQLQVPNPAFALGSNLPQQQQPPATTAAPAPSNLQPPPRLTVPPPHPTITITAHADPNDSNAANKNSNLAAPLTDHAIMMSPTGSDFPLFVDSSPPNSNGSSPIPSLSSAPSPQPLINLDDTYRPLPHETFFGYLDTPQDALSLMQAARINGLNLLPRVKARLSAPERAAIRSGSIFVFDQEESNIKRWTDGMNWSPSRIHNGCFLIYRQIVKREENDADPGPVDDPSLPRGPFVPGTPGLEVDLNEPGFNAQLRDAMVVKRNGMVKKTISLEYEGRHVHVISYYHRADVMAGRLPIPHRTEQLGHIIIPAELRETLLKNSLTRTVPINKETVGQLAQGLPHLMVPQRHQSDGALQSGSYKIRSRSRNASPNPIRNKSLDLASTPAVPPERSNSMGSSSSMYLMPPSPVNLTPPAFESMLSPAGSRIRQRSRSPSSALFSSSPPTVDDNGNVRVSPYRQRRDSNSSSGSSAYGSLRRRASSSSRNITASPLLDSGGTLAVANNNVHNVDTWDNTPPVSSLPSPTGSEGVAGSIGKNNSSGAGNPAATLSSAFRFEITAPDDEPSSSFTQYPYAASPSPAVTATALSPSFGASPQGVVAAPPSPLMLGSPAPVLLGNQTQPVESLRRQTSSGSFSSFDSTMSQASTTPSLLAPGSVSPASRPSSPADSIAGGVAGLGLGPHAGMAHTSSFLLPPPAHALAGGVSAGQVANSTMLGVPHQPGSVVTSAPSTASSTSDIEDHFLQMLVQPGLQPFHATPAGQPHHHHHPYHQVHHHDQHAPPAFQVSHHMSMPPQHPQHPQAAVPAPQQHQQPFHALQVPLHAQQQGFLGQAHHLQARPELMPASAPQMGLGMHGAPAKLGEFGVQVPMTSGTGIVMPGFGTQGAAVGGR
ncbi:hypothetical protein HDU96_007726 [Phlyctochytrium bullatum]|nr:hypothetical protein HDU96_007726 [Phlyctochytrium bullatum]